LHLTSSSSVFSAHGESERNTETHTRTHTEHESFGRWADLALPCSWRESLVKFTHYPQSWWLSGRS
jgi:hypothetical protein